MDDLSWSVIDRRSKFVSGKPTLATAVLALALLATSLQGCGCSEPPSLTSEVRAAARELALRHQDPSKVHLYVDATGSMRGFALAATHNERQAGEPLAALLSSLEAIVRNAGRGEDDIGSQSPSRGPRAELSLFGTDIRNVGQVSLVGPFLGTSWWAQDFDATASGIARSRDCAKSWVGSSSVRRQLDRNFRYTESCLAPVFREIATTVDSGRAFVVLTDAEQVATPGGDHCGAPENFAEVQTEIARLLEAGRYSAMVVDVNLPFHPWWSLELPGSQDRFCECTSKPLYLYFFSPSSSFLDATWRELQSALQVGPRKNIMLTKTDLAPPPAFRSSLKLTLLDEWSYFIPAEKGEEDWEVPPQSVLPVIRLRLEKEVPTRVGLELTSLEFRSTDPALEDANLEWSVAYLAPRGEELGSPIDKIMPAGSPDGSSPQKKLLPSSTHSGVLEVGLVPLETNQGPANRDWRSLEAEFHAGPDRQGLSRWKGEVSSVGLEMRRWGDGHGEDVILLQVSAERAGSPQEWQSVSGIGAGGDRCRSDAATGDYLVLAKPTAVVGKWIIWVTW